MRLAATAPSRKYENPTAIGENRQAKNVVCVSGHTRNVFRYGPRRWRLKANNCLFYSPPPPRGSSARSEAMRGVAHFSLNFSTKNSMARRPHFCLKNSALSAKAIPQSIKIGKTVFRKHIAHAVNIVYPVFEAVSYNQRKQRRRSQRKPRFFQ